jgi:hypothetical protein
MTHPIRIHRIVRLIIGFRVIKLKALARSGQRETFELCHLPFAI